MRPLQRPLNTKILIFISESGITNQYRRSIMKRITIIACLSVFLMNCATNKSAHHSQSVKKAKTSQSVSGSEKKAKKSRMNCRRGAATTGSNLSSRNCKKRNG